MWDQEVGATLRMGVVRTGCRDGHQEGETPHLDGHLLLCHFVDAKFDFAEMASPERLADVVLLGDGSRYRRIDCLVRHGESSGAHQAESTRRSTRQSTPGDECSAASRHTFEFTERASPLTDVIGTSCEEHVKSRGPKYACALVQRNRTRNRLTAKGIMTLQARGCTLREKSTSLVQAI